MGGCGWLRPQLSGNRDPRGPIDVSGYIRNLEAPGRDAYQRPAEVIEQLHLQPDAVVADVGCGPGYFARRLARALPRGLVYAIDVEPRQLDRLNEHLLEDGLTNVIPVLAPVGDPRLPPGGVDLILIVDTYHHFSERSAYLAKLAAGLKATGRLVIIDYHKRDLPIGPPVEHKMAREQILQEVQDAGFRLIEEPALLPYQYFLVFAPPSR
jgi:ubiquinone/menaquinone biosynthesis C-methylase UbiE